MNTRTRTVLSLGLALFFLVCLFPARQFEGSIVAINGRHTPDRVVLWSGNIVEKGPDRIGIDWGRVCLELAAVSALTAALIVLMWRRNPEERQRSAALTS